MLLMLSCDMLQMMLSLQAALMRKFMNVSPDHIMPSNKSEVMKFFRLGISEA